jgi:16S rRNA processing protein RimM
MSSRSSKKTTSEETVVVGRVLRSHGIRGEVVVEPYSDVPERFDPGAELLLAGRPVTVATVRPHRGGLLVRFERVLDRDVADTLRGGLLEIARDAVPEAPEETWYYFELVGCRCHDRREGDLGNVTDVIEDGGGVLLDVRAGGRRLLVPFVRAFVRRVDREAGRIELDLPEGLVEACASRS